MHSTALSSRPVVQWLRIVCVLIVAMVGVGGITRLTGSGLSITDWKPLMGAIPPLNAENWNAVFSRYQASPQYLKLHQGMSLAEFKFIFFWEYIHRLLGRLMAMVLLLPALYFYMKKKIPRPFFYRAIGGFFLGGLQGALGWFMVKSGLVDRPEVSHFRLAAHLLLALLILAYFVWLSLDAGLLHSKWAPPNEDGPLGKRIRAPLLALCFLLVGQIVYGAFVAGLKAGWAFNTFPLMAGHWVPANFAELIPLWKNFLMNPATVQWVHRWLGFTLLILAGVIFLRSRDQALGVPDQSPLRRRIRALVGMLGVQFTLGVTTLITLVPLPLAVIHQLGAAILVILVTASLHALRKSQSTPRSAGILT